MPHDDLFAVIRLRIRRERVARELRQEDVAERLGVALRSYQRFESQVRAFDPKLGSLVDVAAALGVELCELVREPTGAELRELREPPYPLERVRKK